MGNVIKIKRTNNTEFTVSATRWYGRVCYGRAISQLQRRVQAPYPVLPRILSCAS